MRQSSGSLDVVILSTSTTQRLRRRTTSTRSSSQYFRFMSVNRSAMSSSSSQDRRRLKPLTRCCLYVCLSVCQAHVNSCASDVTLVLLMLMFFFLIRFVTPVQAPGPNAPWKHCRLRHYIDCLCFVLFLVTCSLFLAYIFLFYLFLCIFFFENSLALLCFQARCRRR